MAENDVSLLFPPKLSMPELLIPGKQPTGPVEVDRLLCQKFGVVAYYPYLGFRNMRATTPYPAPILIDLLADNNKNGYEAHASANRFTINGIRTLGVTNAGLYHSNIEHQQNLLDGAGVVRISVRVSWQTIDSGTEDGNTVLEMAIDATNKLGFQITLTTGGKLKIGARSEPADLLGTAIGSKTFAENQVYDIEAVFDYAADKIYGYIDGQEDINSAITFGSSTLDCSTGLGSVLMYKITQADNTDGTIASAIFQRDNNHSIARDPYQFLKPAQ
jgi:hypothetical protein